MTAVDLGGARFAAFDLADRATGLRRAGRLDADQRDRRAGRDRRGAGDQDRSAARPGVRGDARRASRAADTRQPVQRLLRGSSRSCCSASRRSGSSSARSSSSTRSRSSSRSARASSGSCGRWARAGARWCVAVIAEAGDRRARRGRCSGSLLGIGARRRCCSRSSASSASTCPRARLVLEARTVIVAIARRRVRDGRLGGRSRRSAPRASRRSRPSTTLRERARPAVPRGDASSAGARASRACRASSSASTRSRARRRRHERDLARGRRRARCCSSASSCSWRRSPGPLRPALGRPLRALGVTGRSRAATRCATRGAPRRPRRRSSSGSPRRAGRDLRRRRRRRRSHDAVDRGIRADFVLKAQQFAGFSPQVARACPRCSRASTRSRRSGSATCASSGNEETVAGVDPTALARVVDLDVGRVAIARPRRRTACSSTEDAAERVRRRTSATARSSSSRARSARRSASPGSTAGGLHRRVPGAVHRRRADLRAGLRDRRAGHARLRDGAATATTRPLGAPIDACPAATTSRTSTSPRVQQYQDQQEQAIDQFLAVTVALLLLAEIIAVLGIVNTLALSVYERTRELGLLRAVGMTPPSGAADGARRVGHHRGASAGSSARRSASFWGWAFTAALERRASRSSRSRRLQLVVFVLVVGGRGRRRRACSPRGGRAASTSSRRSPTE